MSRVLATTLAVLLAGCTSIPTSVLLRIEGQIAGPLELVLAVFDTGGVAVKDRVLGNGANTLPATTVLFPPQDHELRILVRARHQGVVVGEGATIVELQRNKQVTATVTIIKGRLPDQDSDDVPDILDNCPNLPNPDQGSCTPTFPDGAPADFKSDADAGVPDGPELDRSPDVERDLAPTDLPPKDLPPKDLPPKDAGGYKPLSVAALQAAFTSAKVPCIDETGAVAGSPIPLVDTPALSFFSGSVTLAAAITDTKSWVGTKQSVVVVWDPNACGAWEESPGNPEWKSAGLLIRDATLDFQGRILLEPWVGIDDINMLNVDVDGTFEHERFKANDSGLSSMPQLVNTVTEAKKLVLSTAKQ
jgi:hypothetical protein